MNLNSGFIIVIAFVFVACTTNKLDCEKSAEVARKTECLLIFEKLPVFSSPYLNAKGKHLYTKKECECEDNARWWTQYRDLLKRGDTIVKKRGELAFNIHKKDTILSFEWDCEGKVYK